MVLLLPVGVYLALQVPALQTWGARRVAVALSERFNAEVSVGKVCYVFFNRLIVNDIRIMSSETEVLIGCKKLSARFNPRDILSSKYHFTHLNLYDGVFNIEKESSSETNVSRVFAQKEPRDSSRTSTIPDISIENLNLRDFRFTLRNQYAERGRPEVPESVIDFADLQLSNIDIDMRRVLLAGDTLTAKIGQLNFTEKSGFTLGKLTGDLVISDSKAQIDNLYIDDGYSKVKADYFYMAYDSLSDFREYVNNITMGISLRNSTLSFVTLGKFAGKLRDIPLSIGLTGIVSGPVSNLRSERLEIVSESGGTLIDVRARLSGLPNSSETMAFVDVNSCQSSVSELQSIFYLVNENNPVKFVKTLSPSINFTFKGRLAGLLDDFVANGTLESSVGELYMDALLRRNVEEKGIDLIGNLRPESFDVGTLIGNNSIGKLSMNTTLSALLRERSDGGSRYMIDSLRISKLELMDYSYTNVSAVGSYFNNTFDGKVIVRDPNLDMLFQGIFGFSTQTNSYYDFYSEVIYADLNALNINKRDSISVVSFRALANFSQNLRGDFDGTVNVNQFYFTNGLGSFPVGNISIQSRTEENNFMAELNSDFANVRYRGNDFLTNLTDRLFNIVLHDNLDAVFPKVWGDPSDISPKSYSLQVDFKDMRYITLFALPGLDIANNSFLSINIDEQNRVQAQVISDRIEYQNISANNIRIEIGGDSSSVVSTLLSDQIMLWGISLDSTTVSFNLHDNLLEIGSEYRNRSQFENRLNFTSAANFIRFDPEHPPIIDFTITPSTIYLNGELWNLGKARIIKQDSTFVFHNVNLYRDDQYLNIDGIVSANPYDTLSLSVSKIDISLLNSVMNKPLGIHGDFTGYAYALDLYNAPQILFDFKGDRAKIFDKDIGELTVESKWNSMRDHFQLKIVNRYGERVPLIIDGAYKFIDNHIDLDLKAIADSLQVNIFESFVKDVFPKSSGTFSGELNLTGPLDKLVLTSEKASLNSVGLTVGFTNVAYTLDGPVVFTNKGVLFDNVDVRDRAGNRGSVTGGIEYEHFDNLRFNTNVNFTNIETINLREDDNPYFYGAGYGTGRLNLSGPLSKINIDVSITPNKNTTIHIPVSNREVSRTNLLNFTQSHTEDLHFTLPLSQGSVQRLPTELDVKLMMSITPDAQVVLEIDKSLGDAITGYGTGRIEIEVNPLKDLFNIRGDYNIQQGWYKFVLQGILERDFNILEGGNIRFNGDINKTELNLTAAYTTRASVSMLLAERESTDASIRRNVDCMVYMSGPLMNPILSFDIDIPDIDPIIRARVNAALNNDDEVMKQVMALLISGNFIPSNVASTNIVNNSSILYSNATEVLSNQINRILNQLDIPLDLSFNYQQGQDGRDLFDAAVSTQLFNNRVVINGNIGSSDYSDKGVVGDLDIELKIDEKGRFRVKAFSHSADNYSNYLDKLNGNSQRNGVGLVYQEEFRTFKELLAKVFRRKNR